MGKLIKQKTRITDLGYFETSRGAHISLEKVPKDLEFRLEVPEEEAFITGTFSKKKCKTFSANYLGAFHDEEDIRKQYVNFKISDFFGVEPKTRQKYLKMIEKGERSNIFSVPVSIYLGDGEIIFYPSTKYHIQRIDG